jgi:hypothetical protein
LLRPSQPPLHSNKPLPLGKCQVRRFVTHIVHSGAPTPDKCCHASTGESALPLRHHQIWTLERLCGERILAPPAGSQPLLRLARGPLLVPYKPGTPAYKLEVKIGEGMHSRTDTWPTAPDPASQHGISFRAATCSTTLDPPPSTVGLQCCHVPHSVGPCLPAQEGSGVVMIVQ